MTELLAPPAVPEQSVFTQQPQRLVSFLTTGVPPPSDLYLAPTDAIRVELFSQNAGIPIFVKMRYVTPTGDLQYEEEQMQTTTLASSSVADFNIGEAFLLSVAVVTGQSSTQRGRVYASVSYIRAFGGPSVAFMHTLVQGYVTAVQRVSWPILQADYPINGQGLPVYLTLNSPAAGSNFAYTIPNNLRVRLMSMFFNLTTSATVGSRAVSVQVIYGGAACVVAFAPTTQAASVVQSYTCASGYPSAAPTGGAMYIPWPFNLLLQAAGLLEIVVGGIQSGDQISNVDVGFEEWIDM